MNEDELTVAVASLDRALRIEISALRREIDLTSSAANDAVRLAAMESKERLASHNGLIEQMRNQAAHYATREVVDLNRDTYLKRFERVERWQSQLTGGLILIALMLPPLTAYLVHLLNR